MVIRSATIVPLGPRVATAGAVFACLVVVAWWGVRVAAPRPSIAPAVQTAAALPDPAMAAMLFGVAGPVAPVARAEQRLAAVKVLGVLVHPQRGGALVSVDGAPVRAFALGETLSPGLKLIEVTADSAVFERFGERIELAAPRRSSAEVLQQGPQPAAVPSSGRSAEGPPR